MLVCHCHGVTDRTIRQSVREGAGSCAQVTRRCRAGGCCGGCRPVIREIIASECSEPGSALLFASPPLAQAG